MMYNFNQLEKSYRKPTTVPVLLGTCFFCWKPTSALTFKLGPHEVEPKSWSLRNTRRGGWGKVGLFDDILWN